MAQNLSKTVIITHGTNPQCARCGYDDNNGILVCPNCGSRTFRRNPGPMVTAPTVDIQPDLSLYLKKYG